jgi:S1-C subfamily serine protease
MITNLSGNSGGSGTIISSNKDYSEILTNSHVCGVVERGGNVITDNGIKHFVTSYKKSSLHDLCLITVAEDLHVASKLAEASPKKYSLSIVSGHPKLLPTIISRGHFSSKLEVSVMIGTRECTVADQQTPATQPFCDLLGKLPIIKTYDAVITSALIQPGSSGSGIFNSNNELSAVVFAGSGDIGYGLAVPYEYVSQFLSEEILHLLPEIPNTFMQFPNLQEEERLISVKDFSRICHNSNLSNELCSLIKDVSKFNDALVR